MRSDASLRARAASWIERAGVRFDKWATRVGADRLRWVVAFVALALLVVALVPLVGISFFNHSYADDWHYGVDAHLALQATGSPLAAVEAALAEVADTYFSWQGTYSAIFLMALQPGVFGEGFYALAALIILALLVLGTGYAAWVLVVDVLRAPSSTWLTLTCLVLLLQTQLLPSPVEGIFWYNSAVYYTGYHALMLVMVGVGVRMALPSTRRQLVRRAATLALLAFVVAGGNFVTALVTLELLVATFAALAWRRNPRAVAFLPALLVHVTGFAASMLAPGNAVRQLSQFPEDALSVPMTVLRSAFAGCEYTVLWTNGLLVAAFAVAAPLLVHAARRSGFSFRYPGAVAFAALVLFATSFTPTFYSMGSVGPGRVQNIRYDLFVLLAFVCLTWLLGWWSCCRETRVPRKRAACDPSAAEPGAAALAYDEVPSESRSRASKRDPAGMRGYRADDAPCTLVESFACVPRRIAAGLVASLAFVLAMGTAFALDERHVDDLTSFSAAASLASGEAAAYDAQVRERLDYLETSSSSTVEVPFYTEAPEVLFMGDVRDNMDNYINFRLAQWYGKDSVVGRHGASVE